MPALDHYSQQVAFKRLQLAEYSQNLLPRRTINTNYLPFQFAWLGNASSMALDHRLWACQAGVPLGPPWSYGQFRFRTEAFNLLRTSKGLPWWLSGEEPTCQSKSHRRHGFDPWVRRSPGEGNGHPLQYACLGNPMDGGAWRATATASQESQTWLSGWTKTATTRTSEPFQNSISLHRTPADLTCVIAVESCILLKKQGYLGKTYNDTHI